MSKRKILGLLLSGGFLIALGLNCLPNIGSNFPNHADLAGMLAF